MVLLPCSSCCCKMPAPPDEIEVEISSSTSHFGTLTLGRYASAGCAGPVAEASMSVLFTAPVGVFTLTRAGGAGGAGVYSYAEDYGSAGTVHQILANVGSDLSDVSLQVSLVRRVWVLGGTPATRESLEPLTWGEGRLGEAFTGLSRDSPSFNAGGIPDTFSLAKATINGFPQLIVRDAPASPSCRTIEIRQQDSDTFNGRLCGAAGCAAPFDVRIDVNLLAGLVDFPRLGAYTATNWAVTGCPVVGDAYLRGVLSSTGVMSPWPPASAAAQTMEVTFRVSRITLIYDGQPSAPQFEPRGTSRCTLPANYDVANCP
jgi:hypothetical protein